MNSYVAECVGTALLIIFGNGVVANVVLARSKGNAGGWIVIAAGWAVAVAMAVFATARVSGAHLNPAVTIALASVGSFPWNLVGGYVVAQVIGGFIGSVFVYLLYYSHWEITTDTGAKLACHCTAPAVRRMGPAFLCEFLATGIFLFMVLALSKLATGATSEAVAWAKTMNSWFGPLVVALLVLGVGLSLGGPTGYAINPARDFGPRLAHAVLPIRGKGDSDWSYAWVPVLAPILGGIAGAQLFQWLGI